METEKIIFFRNFLFRSFFVGIAIAIVFALITFVLWDLGASLSERFFKVDEKEFGKMIFTFFMNVRIVLLFLFLAPALALHWMVKSKG